MIDISKGRYWDSPWSLVSGCTPCSPGCEHCWSASMTHRFHHPMSNLTTIAGKFAGHIVVHPERLGIPLSRRKPTVYAVWNDFWHESVPDDFQYKAYDAMVERHTFLILTKRPHIAAAYYAEGKHEDLLPRDNIWHGLTVCNQQEADKKIPVFLQVPGKKFLSIEPMLGPIDDLILRTDRVGRDITNLPGLWDETDNRIAVILGGETGPGARPMHPGWVRSVRDRCVAANVPFFFKSRGEWAQCDDDHLLCRGRKQTVLLPDGSMPKKGRNWENIPGARPMYRGGRKKAGRLLDGRTHDDLPWRVV